MKVKCEHCDGTGYVEVAETLSLASLLEPFITEDSIGFRLKEGQGLATIDRLPPLNQPEVRANAEAFGDVVEKIAGVE